MVPDTRGIENGGCSTKAKTPQPAVRQLRGLLLEFRQRQSPGNAGTFLQHLLCTRGSAPLPTIVGRESLPPCQSLRIRRKDPPNSARGSIYFGWPRSDLEATPPELAGGG